MPDVVHTPDQRSTRTSTQQNSAQHDQTALASANPTLETPRPARSASDDISPACPKQNETRDDSIPHGDPRARPSRAANQAGHRHRHRVQYPQHLTPHGSYASYYDRRDDDRVSLLKPEWISASRRVLDIGCNDGAVAFATAERLAPIEVLAVDIDRPLVQRARAKLASLVRDSIATAGTQSESANLSQDIEVVSKTFPYNVRFRSEDFAQENGTALRTLKEHKFSMIMALSVSKWIHMHNGDVGIKRFFKRVYDLLEDTGVFVLEPQPSRSYRRAMYRARKEGPEAQQSLTPIEKLGLRPEAFPEYLLSPEIGFARMDMLRDAGKPGQPFNRRVMAFFKSQHLPPEDAAPVAERKPGAPEATSATPDTLPGCAHTQQESGVSHEAKRRKPSDPLENQGSQTVKRLKR